MLRRHTKEEMVALAVSRGGEFLSSEYTAFFNLHRWRCAKGHEWSATPANVHYKRSWCPYCSKNAIKDMNYCQAKAAERSFVLLDTVYKGMHARYMWQCSQGHQWTAPAVHVLTKGRGCLQCSGLARKDVAWLQALAARREGKCLSDVYINSKTQYSWECARGHHWEASANNISNGWWCPTCSKKRSQKELMIYHYVKAKYPDALSSPTKMLKSRRLTLDIYVPSLKKAVEFDGYWCHKSDWAKARGMPEKDARKNQQCVDAGIRLLRVDERVFDINRGAVLSQVDMFLGG